MASSISEATIAAAVNLRGSLHRSFYICLLLSSVTLYLVYEETYGSPIFSLKVQFENALSSTEAILEVNDMIYNDAKAVREYLRFLEPLVAIESASTQAIVGVEDNDERWLSLDPILRDLARSITDSPTWLHHNVDQYVGDNFRELPVHNIKEFSKWLIYPEVTFNNHDALRKLDASFHVARKLGQNIEEQSSWPDSFRFLDFIEEKGFEGLAAKIHAVRNLYNYNDIVFGIDRIERLCEDNKVSTCSPNVLNVLFADEPNRLVPDVKEKISVSFFPVGIEKSIVIKMAPVVLLVVFFQFIGYERRWRRFVEADSTHEKRVHGRRNEVLWAITDAIHPQFFSLGSFSVGLHNHAMLALVTVALVIPSLAQVAVLVYGYGQGWGLVWLGPVCLCGVLTGTCLVGLLRSSWSEARPDMEESKQE